VHVRVVSRRTSTESGLLFHRIPFSRVILIGEDLLGLPQLVRVFHTMPERNARRRVIVFELSLLLLLS